MGVWLIIRLESFTSGQLSAFRIPHDGDAGRIIQGLLQADVELREGGRAVDRHVGDRGQEGHVENPLMGFAVVRHDPGPVHGQDDVVVHDGRIVEDLVIAALQKGGVDGENRQHPAGGQPGGKGDGVLLRDPHIEKTDREPLSEFRQAGAALHGGGDGTDAQILLRQAAQAVRHRRGEGFGGGRRLPGFDIEPRDPVIGIGILCGEAVPLSLDRLDMQKNRTAEVLRGLERSRQVMEIVPVHRA